MLLFQVYPIMLATAASINTDNLSFRCPFRSICNSVTRLSVPGLFCSSGRVQQTKHAIPKTNLGEDFDSVPRARPTGSLAGYQFDIIVLPTCI